MTRTVVSSGATRDSGSHQVVRPDPDQSLGPLQRLLRRVSIRLPVLAVIHGVNLVLPAWREQLQRCPLHSRELYHKHAVSFKTERSGREGGRQEDNGADLHAVLGREALRVGDVREVDHPG